ncbi:MAG: lepB-B [Parachlamydiales bacterium]|nr:lepB-B [Parachlamydiales bacterium]
MENPISNFFLLNKCRRILRQSLRLYRRKAKTLSSVQKEELQTLLLNLQNAIVKKDAAAARRIAPHLLAAAHKALPKSAWDHARDFLSALLFALVVAIAIRQTWFELYSIPSGSMRPTLKEEDFLLVSKTDFGINTVTRTSHFTFDPDLVHRGQIVIFSVDNMDVSDPDTMYFYLIPGKKQFVKRLIGKPGDTLYFYGGRIYGIDSEGRDIEELRSSDWIQPLEHIPFIRFDGKPQTPSVAVKGIFSPVVFHQMNEPIAKLQVQDYGKIFGEMLVPMKNYDDVWGFKNFAMARLLTTAELKQLYPQMAKDTENAPLYLELTHHPSLTNPTLSRDEYRRLRPELSTSVSILPLDEKKIDEIMRRMITCRFIVKDSMATRYGSSFATPQYLPHLKGVPDGTYEIQDGKAYRVLWTGITYQLPANHPLLSHDPHHVQQLYNLGIEMDTHFSPANPSGLFFPSRYAYFRNGHLFLLGAPIVEKGDPALVRFSEIENQKHAASIAYAPFEDMGPPMKDGKIDAEWIRRYGLKVPDKMYLVLGDNHAMSADSRQFGFVPQDNLRGGASFILWPCGPRWGRLVQPAIAHLTLPNMTIWGIFIVIAISSTIYLRRQAKKPLDF